MPPVTERAWEADMSYYELPCCPTCRPAYLQYQKHKHAQVVAKVLDWSACLDDPLRCNA